MTDDSAFEHALADLLAGRTVHADSTREDVETLCLLSLLQAEWSATDGPSAADTAVWGHLELLDEIGRGSSGTVWRAWDPRLARTCAVKLLDPHVTEPAAALREGRSLASVRHPAVLSVFGAEVHDGMAGLWMELIDGESLEALVRRDGTLGQEEALAAVVAVAGASSAVHAAGLVHGDIKARNVLRERGGRIVLADLGTATSITAQPTPAAAGTLLYMAPELLAGGVPTVASDVYAMGVLLYYLLTGRHPVEAADVATLTRLHTETDATPASARIEGVPDGVAEVLTSMLARVPDNRPPSARHVEDALRRQLTTAIRRHPVVRHRWLPRYFAALSSRGVAALVVLALAGVASCWWIWATPLGRTARRAVGLTVGPSSPLVLTFPGAVGVVRGTQVTLHAGNPHGAAVVAVDGAGRVRTATGLPGSETGGVYGSALDQMEHVAGTLRTCCFYDGTSDGVHHYAIRHDSTLTATIGTRQLAPAAIYRFSDRWGEPQLLFTLAQTPEYIGIAYVARLRSFAVTRVTPEATDIELWSIGGESRGLVARLESTTLTGIAYDRADDTLWLVSENLAGSTIDLVNLSMDGQVLTRLQLSSPAAHLPALGVEAVPAS